MKAKKAYIPFAYSPNSVFKTLVNLVENKAKAGYTSYFHRLLGLNVFFIPT